MTLDENLQLLEDSIRRLKIEYDIFFSGAVRKPPYDLRHRVDSLLKRLLEEKKMTFAQRYRYNTLVARYSSYRDLWRRLVQDKEMAISPEPVIGTARTAEPTASSAIPDAAESTESPARGSAYPSETAYPHASAEHSLKIQISDPARDMGKVQALYEFLTDAQSRLGEKKILPFENFCSLVKAKTEKLKETARCRYVTFNITIEDDKVKFTARPGET